MCNAGVTTNEKHTSEDNDIARHLDDWGVLRYMYMFMLTLIPMAVGYLVCLYLV